MVSWNRSVQYLWLGSGVSAGVWICGKLNLKINTSVDTLWHKHRAVAKTFFCKSIINPYWKGEGRATSSPGSSWRSKWGFWRRPWQTADHMISSQPITKFATNLKQSKSPIFLETRDLTFARVFSGLPFWTLRRPWGRGCPPLTFSIWIYHGFTEKGFFKTF